MPKREPAINDIASTKKIMRHSHASKDIGSQGRSIIERIEQQMDRRRKVMEALVVENGFPNDLPPDQRREYYTNNGRYEGLAAALGLLRNSSVAEEIRRSNERLGIE